MKTLPTLKKLRNLILLLVVSCSFFYCTKFELPPFYDNGTVGLISRSPNSIIPTVDAKSVATLKAAVTTNNGTVISSDGYLINVWNYKTDTKISSFNNNSFVSSIALSADERYLYTGSDEAQIRKYDWKSGNLLASFPGTTNIKKVKLSSTGRFLVTLSRNTGLNLHLWDTENGKLINAFQLDSPVSKNDVSVSGDGKYIAISGFSYLKVWNAETLEIVSDLSAISTSFGEIAFTPDNNYLICNQLKYGLSFSGIKVYDFLKKEVVKSYDITYLQASSGLGQGLTLSAEGRYCFTGQAFLDLQESRFLWFVSNDDYQGDCGISPNGKYLVNYESGGKVNLFDVNGSVLNNPVSQLSKVPTESASSKDQLYILAKNQLLIVPFNGEPSKLLMSPNSEAFSEDIEVSNNLVYAKRCQKLYFWNTLDNSYTKQIDLRDRQLNTDGFCNTNITLSPDKKLIVAQPINDLGSFNVYDALNGVLLKTIKGVSPETDKKLFFTNDSKYICGESSDRESITIWNIETGEVVANFKMGLIAARFYVTFAISPEDKVLASFSGSRLRLLSFSTGEVFKEFALIGNIDGKRYVKFSPDGKYVVAASGASVNIFETKSTSISSSYSEVDSDIIGIEFNENGSTLAIVTEKNIHIYRL